MAIHRESKFKPGIPNAACSQCGSTRYRAGQGKIVCMNCDFEIVPKTSKYKNVKTDFMGGRYDSKFEANVAADLELLRVAGEIESWERQFKVEIVINGTRICSHKVDFRVKYPDGTYELLEAKGKETMDYIIRRNLLVAVFLPEHPDHTYRVVKQQDYTIARPKKYT